ncbi:MAG: hypothetical protein J6J61_03295, partial [Muribaculaceae bacterium]|nr:hypothetical protein [Muribaculaceae bacterium]
FDGALGDPVPLQKAFDLGCEKVVLLLTKPEKTIRTPKKDARLARAIERKYPHAAHQLCSRAERYNDSVALARKHAADGKVLIVSPDDTCGVDTLTKDAAALRRLYRKGYADGARIVDFIK